MKTKVEFYVIENIEKQIKDWNLSEEEIEEYKNNRDKVDRDYLKRLEKAIRDEIEYEDYTIIEDFKAKVVEKWKLTNLLKKLKSWDLM